MNILAVQPYGERKGHFGLYASRVCQNLSLLGHDVTLVTSQLEPRNYLGVEAAFRLVRAAPGDRCFLSESVSASPLANEVSRFRAVLKNNVTVLGAALTMLRQQRFDAVHLFDFEPLSTWLLLTLHKGSLSPGLPPLVMVLHPADFEFGMYRRRPYRGLYKVVCRSALRWLTSAPQRAITVHSEWHKHQLQGQLALDAELGSRVTVVPYPADMPKEWVPRAEARRRIGLDYDGPLFLFFGMIRKDKGIETLLTATAMLDEEFRLLVAGSPFDYSIEELHALVGRLTVQHRVVTDFGYIPESAVDDYLFAADAVVLPYNRSYVGGAGPLLAACSHGRPVIASRVAEMASLLEREPIGIGVSPEEPVSLANAMRRFLSLEPSAKASMSRHCLELAKARSWAGMAQAFSDIYTKLLITDSARGQHE